MLFTKIFSGIAMASAAMAGLTPQQIADGLNTLTQKSTALQGPAQSITLVNALLFPLGQGPYPQIVSGLTDIISTTTTLIALFPGTQPIQKRGEMEHARDLSARGADADLVFNAFRAFVRAHQILLNILIGKAGILGHLPIIGQPVAAVLRQVEGVVDTVAITLINITQARAGDLSADADSLGNTLDLAIQSYNSLI
ncbi:UVI-1 [Nemania sp. NC0429]|nr:UVI-1 [Nemania sp. NC0429]